MTTNKDKLLEELRSKMDAVQAKPGVREKAKVFVSQEETTVQVVRKARRLVRLDQTAEAVRLLRCAMDKQDHPGLRLELSKLYEHQLKDYPAALQYALDSAHQLEGDAAAEKRISRLKGLAAKEKKAAT